MKRSKIISYLFILLGLTALLYLITIIPLYYFTGAKSFKHPDGKSIEFYYDWTKAIDNLQNLWLLAFLIWIPFVIIVSFLKRIEKPRKSIWFSTIAFILAAYVTFGSRIGAEWWNEYALMIHDLHSG